MSYLCAVGITVGLLAGAWCFAADTLGLIAFVGFLGWASYFAAGSGWKGVKSAACSNLSGVIWGVVTIFLCGLVPAIPSFFFTILFAAIMCWQAKIDLLSFIPGTFIGNAAFYASGNKAIATSIALICGILLGILSDKLAQMISKKE